MNRVFRRGATTPIGFGYRENTPQATIERENVGDCRAIAVMSPLARNPDVLRLGCCWNRPTNRAILRHLRHDTLLHRRKHLVLSRRVHAAEIFPTPDG